MITERERLVGLEKRLVECQGPDRELDEAIYQIADPKGYVRCVNEERELRGVVAAKGMLEERGEACHRSAFTSVPQYTYVTGSAVSWVPLDVGISMVIPEPEDGKPYASIYNKARGHIARGSGATLPIAVLLASCRALIALLPQPSDHPPSP